MNGAKSPIVGVILLLLAAAVVYQSSPQRHLAAQGSSAGTDQLYVIEANTGRDLYRLPDTGVPEFIATTTTPGCSGFTGFSGMDTAPDGTVYALALCGAGGGHVSSWGRFDPDTAVFTPLQGLSDATPGIYPQPSVNFGLGFKIAFLPQFGAPGTPIGYRIRLAAPNQIGGPGMQIYAIDALAPYREHSVDGDISPLANNYGLGLALSRDGATMHPVTVDMVYRFLVSALTPPVRDQIVQPAVNLGVLELSPDTAVSSAMDANGFFSIIDGIRWWRVKPSAPTQITGGVNLPGLNFVQNVFLRRAPLGGVRVEPTEQLTTSESGTTATFTAVLTAQPTASVTLNFTSSDTSEGTVSPASATFTTIDWKTPQTITVTGVLDNDTADQPFSIVTASTSVDPNYHERGILDVSVTNTDVNQAPALAAGSPSAQQGSAAATATLGTASDLETAAGSLTVATLTVPSGLTVDTITNTGGVITAPLTASCSAPTGARTLTLSVTDDASTSTEQDVIVTVLPNTTPTLGTYGAPSVLPGGSTIVTATASPGDNGSIVLVEVSSPAFTGSLSVNGSTGAVSVSNASPIGVHIVTVTATDNCGTTFSRTFDLTVNTPPTLTPGTPSAQQGSPAIDATLGTVGDPDNDDDSAPGSLIVETVTVPSGVTVGTITNTGGTITAPLSASCSAPTGARTLTLRVADGLGTTDQNVTVTVLANTAPTLGTYSATSITPGASTSATSTAAPADTGTVASVIASSPTFTGTLSVDASTGTVSVSNAAPSGIHIITVTVTDTCGATVSRTFDLTVNALPILTPATPSAQQGSPATGATLGTVSDTETGPGSLTVTTIAVPSGLTVGTIGNTAGTIAAPLTATCSATPGPRTLTLRVTDGIGATTDQDVTVTVLANAAPTLGAYASASIVYAGNTMVLPSASPGDNGTVALVEVSSSTFTGTLSVNASNGTVSVSNAGPVGAHTVTITATDNCGTTSSTTFTLTVTCPAFSLGAPGAAFTVGGGSGSVAVASAPGCAWASSSGVPWIGFVTGSGNGDGTATFTVAENRSGAPRSTSLTIGGLPFAVTQSLGFADTVITAGVTTIRAIHLVELRIRIDRLRSRLELPAYGWSDAAVTSAVTPIRAAQINELRTALLQAYAAVGQPEPIFTDQSINSTMVIRAVHFNELRAAIVALEGALQLQ
jgi:hypothetical protein